MQSSTVYVSIIGFVERCRRCTLRNTCLVTRRAERFEIGIGVVVWFLRMFNSVRVGLLWNDSLDRQHAMFAALFVVLHFLRTSVVGQPSKSRVRQCDVSHQFR